MAGYFTRWAEVWFFILLVIGFILSLFAPSAVISYVMVFLLGMMAGRLSYERKTRLKFPYYLMMIGFLIGYILGAFYGNRNVMIILFILGALVSYYMHDSGMIRDIRF